MYDLQRILKLQEDIRALEEKVQTACEKAKPSGSSRENVKTVVYTQVELPVLIGPLMAKYREYIGVLEQMVSEKRNRTS